ncbi:MAG: ABC transporter permease [Planctomycetes bacterium]|nr:ABC transporter permease [Planctomycetota bacterium]
MAGWFFTIRGKAPRATGVLLGLVPVAALLGLWFVLTHGEVEDRKISPTILPSPSEVWSQIPALRDRELLKHTLASLKRVGLGYLLALAVTFPLGVLMGSFGSARALFNPAMTASGYIPIATLVPLTMSWFGTGEQMKIIFLALAFAIYMLPLFVNAIDAVPDVYLRTAATLGASRWNQVWSVLIPVALPDIWNAMRLAFGVGWTYLVLAEVVVLDDGLGYLVEFSRRRGPREHIYLIIVVITLIAWVVDLAWANLGKFIFPYRSDRR